MIAPRDWGRKRGGPDRQWRLTRDAEAMQLTVAGRKTTLAGDDLGRLSAERGWFRHALVVVAGADRQRLTGLHRRDVSEINGELHRMLARHRTKPASAAAQVWHDLA